MQNRPTNQFLKYILAAALAVADDSCNNGSDYKLLDRNTVVIEFLIFAYSLAYGADNKPPVHNNLVFVADTAQNNTDMVLLSL